MKLIEPIDITPASVLTTNVPITETEWTPGTYNLGDQRCVGTTLYQVVASSTADEPTAGAAKDVPTWVKVGGINRFRAFDAIIGQATEKTGTIEYRLQGAGVVDGIALFGLEGETATVRVLRASDEAVLFAQTFSLLGRGTITTWWEWFFAPFEETRDIVLTNLPIETSALIEIEVDGGAGDARIGEAFLGKVQQLGTTVYGTAYEEEDFTRRERDRFGNFIIVERPSTSRISYSVRLNPNQLPRVQRLLRSRRAKATVYIGEESLPTTIVPGFPRDVRVVPLAPTLAELMIEVEGLI